MKGKIKILLVDDEPQFRTTTQKILNKKGFNTILAPDGEEALKKLGEKPDVVVLDIMMPGMDGHQVLREIKKLKSDLPVIMLTGHGRTISAKEAKIHGAFDYLAKPCDIDLLAAKVLEACQPGPVDEPQKEPLVLDVMIPITDYTTITENQSVEIAIKKLRESFSGVDSTSHPKEMGHSSIIVFDEQARLKGILAIVDLLKALMPAYLSAPKPCMADSIQYSPMFWRGAFTREAGLLAKRPVRHIMSPAPRTIDIDSNLIEAAYEMVIHETRRLVVMQGAEVMGIIREQDLFFELEKVLADN